MNYLEELANKEDGLVFITGKGGVGKTTAAALIGYLRSSNGLKTHLISIDPFHSFSDAYGLRGEFEEDPIKTNKKKRLTGKRLNKELIRLINHEIKNSEKGLRPELKHKREILKKGLTGELLVTQLEPKGNKAHTIKGKIMNGVYTEYELMAAKRIIKGYDGLMIIDTDSLEGLQRMISYAHDNKRLMKAIKEKDLSVIPVTTLESMSLEKLDNFFSQQVVKEFCGGLENLIVNNVNDQSWIEFTDFFNELKDTNKIILYEQPFEPAGPGLVGLLTKPAKTEKANIELTGSNKLPDKKVMMFCGKGGQGKTTMACAYALKKALEGKKVYLISADAVSSLSDSLNVHIPSYEKGSPWFDLSKTKAYEGLPIMVYKQEPYLDSIPGVPFYCVMNELMKDHECLIIDAPPSGNIKKSLDLGRKDEDPNQELIFKIDLLQLKLRKKFSEKAGLLLEFLDNRRKSFEQGALVMKSDDFMAVPVVQPTRTALNETLSLESMLGIYETSPYLLPQTHYYRMIINRIGDKPYQHAMLKRMQETYFPEETHKLTLIPKLKEEVKGREMLEEIAEYL